MVMAKDSKYFETLHMQLNILSEWHDVGNGYVLRLKLSYLCLGHQISEL
jgi:hypothetical protein